MQRGNEGGFQFPQEAQMPVIIEVSFTIKPLLTEGSGKSW
jgi:hypothetical protein